MVDSIEDLAGEELTRRIQSGRLQRRRAAPRQAPGVNLGESRQPILNTPFKQQPLFPQPSSGLFDRPQRRERERERGIFGTSLRSMDDLGPEQAATPVRADLLERGEVRFGTRAEVNDRNERLMREQLNNLARSEGFDEPVAYFNHMAEELRENIRARNPALTRQRIPASPEDVRDIGIGRIRQMFGTSEFADQDYADQRRADQFEETARLLATQDSVAMEVLERLDLGFRFVTAAPTVLVHEIGQGFGPRAPENRFSTHEAKAAVDRFLRGETSGAAMLEQLQDAAHLPPGAFGLGEVVGAAFLPPFAAAGPARTAELAMVRGVQAGVVRAGTRLTGPVRYATGQSLTTTAQRVVERTAPARALIAQTVKDETGGLRLRALNTDGPLDYVPAAVPDNLTSRIATGLTGVQTDLSRREKIWTSIKHFRDPDKGREVLQWNALVRAADDSITTFDRQIASRSSVLAAQADNQVARAFAPDEQGRIAALAGIDPSLGTLAPTVQDVAARYPRFVASLTQGQRQTMENLRAWSESYVEWLRAKGKDIPQRQDIIDGGFYLHRGTVVPVEDVLGPVRGSVRAVGGKKSYERAATGESMTQVIEEGAVTYPKIGEAMGRFVTDVGAEVRDDWLVAFFKDLVDPVTGQKLGQSLADRADPQLRAQIEAVRRQVSNLVRTRTSQTSRRGAQKTAAKELDQLANQTQAEALRKANTLARKAERETTEEALGRAEAELDTLLTQLKREHRAASRAKNRQEGTLDQVASTIQRLALKRARLTELRTKWEFAKRAAATPRLGEATVRSVPGLQGLAFPDVLARSIDDMVASRAPRSEDWWMSALNGVNAAYRSLRATGDNSYPLIQGVLASAGDTRGARDMAKVNFLAWRDPNVLGKFFEEHNTRARLTGRLTVEEWADTVLHFGGPDTEFSFGQGFTRKLLDVPILGDVFRAANRAFGYAGDAQRLSMADHLLESELKNRTLKQIIDSGDLQRIADAANKMTGFTYDRPFGSLGDLLLFAPRFLSSRLQTLGKVALGLRPGASIDQRFARRSMLRFITFGATMTELINHLAGNETDRRPFVNGKWNPNFYRIRWGGRDWSLFGTWDSMARLVTNTLTGGANRDLSEVVGGFRGMAGGSTSILWDLISGKDFTGRDTRDSFGTFARWMFENTTPFAYQETPQIFGQVGSAVRSGNAGEAAAGTGLLIGEVFGMKSSPLSYSDVRDIASIEEFGVAYNATDAQGRRVLTNEQRRQVNGSERLTQFTTEFEAQLGDPGEQLDQAFLSYETGKAQAVERLERVVNAQSQPHQVRQAVSDYKRSLFDIYQTAFSTPDVLEAFERSKDKQSQVDILREQYWFADAPTDRFGNADFAARDAVREGIRLQARELGIEDEVTKRSAVRLEDERLAQAVETYNFILDEGLRDFFAIPRDLIGDDEDLQADYSEYLSLPATEQSRFVATHPMVSLLGTMVEQRRLMLRSNDRLVDAIRTVYYESTPRHPGNAQRFAIGGVDAVKEWLDRSIAQRMN